MEPRQPSRSASAQRVAACLLVVALAACGQLSLDELLSTESPGEFAVQPANGYVSLGTQLVVNAQGGFRPYGFEKLSGVGEVDPATGLYEAPDDTGGGDTALILARDRFGTEARATLHVFTALTLDKSTVTVREGEVVTFDADGGVPDPNYEFYVNGVPLQTNDTGVFSFTPTEKGTYAIEVVDSIGNTVGATVTVVDLELAIQPSAAWVLDDGFLDFTAINADDPFFFSVEPAGAGSIVPLAATTARYTPPTVTEQTKVTVRLTDAEGAEESVTAKVYVFPKGSPPAPLTITPAALPDPVPWGAQVVFTAAGGIAPYTFGLTFDENPGTLVQNGVTALYTAPQANAVNWVWLTDDVGATLKVKVRTSK